MCNLIKFNFSILAIIYEKNFIKKSYTLPKNRKNFKEILKY